MIKKTLSALGALAVSGGLALAVPATQAMAAPAPAAMPASLSVLPAPSALRAAPAPHHARLSWGAVAGAAVYELRVSPAGGGAASRVDHVTSALRMTVSLVPGRYAFTVRAGRSWRDVHGHWAAGRYFTVPRSASSSLAGRALAWAYGQAGKPYVYGAAGPSSYDCSGLVMAAYAHADGIGLPRTTGEMLASGKLVRTASPAAGDLAFFGTGHVELFVRPGFTFGAHHSGTVIGLRAYNSYWHPTAFYRVA